MKISYFIILILISSAVHSFEDEYIGCWESVTEELSNTISMCANRKLATATVHYPNKGGTPTICSQFGYAKGSKKDSLIEFDLEEGGCENNRIIDATVFKCNIISDKSLICTHPSGRTLLFAYIEK